MMMMETKMFRMLMMMKKMAIVMLVLIAMRASNQ
jgi:hypothetical protein